jgi:transposase
LEKNIGKTMDEKYVGANHREFTPEFKAKVALEALKERVAQKDLAEKYEIHSARVCEWRKELIERSKEIFSPKKTKDDDDKEKIAKLYQQIGELSFELEWLKKKLQGLA